MQIEFNDNNINEGNNHKFTILDYRGWLNSRTKSGIEGVTIETTKNVKEEREGIKTNEEMTI